MANALQDTIDKMKEDGAPEALIAFLESKKSELSDNVSEEDVEKLLLEHLMSEVISASEDVQLDSAETEFMASATRTVREIFDEDEWPYSEKSARPDYVVFEAGCRGNHCKEVRLRVAVETEPRCCHIKAILPILAEETYAYPLCKLLAHLNCGISHGYHYGDFVYDERNGEVAFESNYPIKNGIDKDNFKATLEVVLAFADLHYDEIRKYSVGRFKKSEVEQILAEVKKLVIDLKTLDE